VCLLLWRVATQRKVKSAEAQNLRVSVVIFGVVALVFVVWQGVRQASPIAAHPQDETITVFAAASMTNALDDVNAAFTKQTGIKVVTSYDASSVLIKQIEGGALDLAKLAGDGRIATGDVKEVPVGLYAKAALEKLGVWPSVESKMAMTVNVRAALAYAAGGETPLSIVYATDAKVEPGA
jgi:molybdate transport system substrate-binding protein